MKLTSILRSPPLAQMVFMASCIYISRAFIDQPDIHILIRFGVGLTTGVAGAALLLMSVFNFRKHATTVDPVNPTKAQTLVTSGVFRLTRNPMYVGMALWLVTVCMLANSLVGLAFVVFFVINLTVNQIRLEEAAMVELFGQSYIAYRRATPRWLWGH